MSVFWLYKHNHLDPRNVSKAQAQVRVHAGGPRHDEVFLGECFSLHYDVLVHFVDNGRK